MPLTSRQRTNQKGYATMRMARRLFEARGGLVETAPNVVRWIMTPGGRRPMSMRHDFYGVWDAIVVYRRPARRIMVQVTSVDHMSHRRDKILASGFPCSAHDLLLGYRGRGWFRVLKGPAFDGEAEEWKAPPAPKKMKPIPSMEFNLRATVEQIAVGAEQ